MLNVQNYLCGGKTFDDLKMELGIVVAKHDTLPLAILNYDQIESPKTNPVVRECRGIVLNTCTYGLVARSFPRFYNWGEVVEEQKDFDWDTVETTEKVDGSLVVIYNFDGQWFANTRGSFGTAPLLNDWQAKFFKIPRDTTWRQAFLQALKIKDLSELNGQLDPKLTYVAEFVSPWNKVVRDYKEPAMYLLTRFDGEQEIGAVEHPLFLTVQKYPLKNVDDITKFLMDHPEATFEGVVAKDAKNTRWKLKNLRYLALHRMKGNNGEQLYNPKNLLPSILAGEGDELLAYFPEVTDFYRELEAKVNGWKDGLLSIWQEAKDIEGQKEFALKIKDYPLSTILFTARKNKVDPMKVFRESCDLLEKRLK